MDEKYRGVLEETWVPNIFYMGYRFIKEVYQKKTNNGWVYLWVGLYADGERC